LALLSPNEKNFIYCRHPNFSLKRRVEEQVESSTSGQLFDEEEAGGGMDQSRLTGFQRESVEEEIKG